MILFETQKKEMKTTILAIVMLFFLMPTHSPAAEDYWAIESKEEREKLPLYKYIEAAKPKELTPANGFPHKEELIKWERSHGGNHNMRFSPLDQINRANVHQLEVAWVYHSKDRPDNKTNNIQCNPIVVNGVMFGPTMGHCIVALNAATGDELWRFKPIDQPAFRGLTYWPGNESLAERLLFNAGDYLWSIDPKTGQPTKDFGADGKIKVGHFRVAPAVYNEIIIFAGYDKDVFGFDLVTGKKLWTFHTIPQPGEFGYDTWDPIDEGANSWGGIALDEQRGIIYVATGSPKPNFQGAEHRGQNLFSNCLIAIHAETGKRLWHFQEVRHDVWDLDIPAAPILVTVNRHGQQVDAVAVVTKIGNTLLLDRLTGKPLFPFRLKRAPASNMPGEKTWPYQPDLEFPQPFAQQDFPIEDVTNISKEARDFVLQKIQPATRGWFEPFEVGRPNVFYGLHGGGEWTGAAFDPASGYLYVSASRMPYYITVVPQKSRRKLHPDSPPTTGEKLYKLYCMACHGDDREGIGVAPPLLALDYRMNDADVIELLKTGRNAMPPSPPMGDQERRDLLDYVFDRDQPEASQPEQNPTRPEYAFLGYGKLLDPDGYPGSKPPWGTLNAIDLNTGRIAWRTVLGEHEELTQRGIPKTGTENFGGATVTAGGLVFCAGTIDSKIRAFDAATGDELWDHKLPFGGYSPPTTYSVNGRQYLVIPSSGGGKLGQWGPIGDAYVAFTLPDSEGQ
jgi:quinoprotein glucose dehydrogenase